MRDPAIGDLDRRPFDPARQQRTAIGRHIDRAQRQADRVADIDALEVQSRLRKQARPGHRNPHRLSEPGTGLPLERQSHPISRQHPVCQRRRAAMSAIAHNTGEQQQHATNHGISL